MYTCDPRISAAIPAAPDSSIASETTKLRFAMSKMERTADEFLFTNDPLVIAQRRFFTEPRDLAQTSPHLAIVEHSVEMCEPVDLEVCVPGAHLRIPQHRVGTLVRNR